MERRQALDFELELPAERKINVYTSQHSEKGTCVSTIGGHVAVTPLIRQLAVSSTITKMKVPPVYSTST